MSGCSLVGGLRSLGDNKFAAPEDVQFASERLHHLPGDVVVKPKDGVLWAHVGLNARGLTEVRPQGASINREFLVAGAGFEPATFGL